MELPKVQSHGSNGTGEAPYLNGASLVAPAQRPRTRFPKPPTAKGFAPLLYRFTHYRFSGISPLRLVYVALGLLALLWLVGVVPGRWWGIGASLTAAAILAYIQRSYRGRDYVHFTQQPPPEVTPAPLSPSAKLPVFATGRFSVEGKAQRFTQLPGFYRTFATREHAVLSIVEDHAWLHAGRIPEEWLGMWYVFIEPGDIQQIYSGELHFGSSRWPALAVDYQVEVPARGGFRGTQIQIETLYLVTENPAQIKPLLADLLYDAPSAHPAPQSPVST